MGVFEVICGYCSSVRDSLNLFGSVFATLVLTLKFQNNLLINNLDSRKLV